MKENGTGKSFQIEDAGSRPSKPPMFFRRPQGVVKGQKRIMSREMDYRERQRQLQRRNKHGP